MTTLDIDLLRTFVTVADARSFTAAGAALGATQSAVSVRLRKLEERLGQRLLERTPRAVALTAQGERFLGDARAVLACHDAAVRRLGAAAPQRLSLGVSDHAAASRLPAVLAGLHRDCPDLRLEVTVGISEQLAAGFGAGRFDAVIVRREPGQSDGQLLYQDALAWMAAPELRWRRDEALPLVSLGAPCSLRRTAQRSLDAAGIAWIEVFNGGGVAAVQAAVSAGLGVACLGARNRPPGAALLGPDDGLPSLPSSAVAMLCRPADARVSGLLGAVAAAFRAS